MLNYETLLSSYDDKLTLLQWLKKVEAALEDASAVDFKVNKKGDATLTFSIVFKDGSEIESGEIVLQQGESVESAAIVNGHLILTLTNGDELDAGALFSGNVNIAGNMAVSGNIASNGKITGAEIVEDMVGYSYAKSVPTDASVDYIYAGICKNGNKLTFVLFARVNFTTLPSSGVFTLGTFGIPSVVGAKLVPFSGADLSFDEVKFYSAYNAKVGVNTILKKESNNVINPRYYSAGLSANVDYIFRYEKTFLLSENLVA